MSGEAQIKGKQIVDGTVTEAKLATAYSQEVMKRNGSVPMTGNLQMGAQKITNVGAPTTGTDAARLQDIFNLNRKEKARVITVSNITLSGLFSHNGVSIADLDRVLVGNAQTDATERGIYVAHDAAAWTRAIDSDSGMELTGAIVWVEEGTVGKQTNYQQINEITTPGSDAQDWIDAGGPGVSSQPTTANKDMAASATTSDGDVACATALAYTPAKQSYIQVTLNGMVVTLGDGVKTEACYFSGDGGVTARSYATIAAGDTLRWVGSVAGYQLEATDSISLHYNV